MKRLLLPLTPYFHTATHGLKVRCSPAPASRFLGNGQPDTMLSSPLDISPQITASYPRLRKGENMTTAEKENLITVADIAAEAIVSIIENHDTQTPRGESALPRRAIQTPHR